MESSAPTSFLIPAEIMRKLPIYAEIKYNNYHFEENNGNIYYKFKINFSQNKSRKVYETQYKFEIYK